MATGVTTTTQLASDTLINYVTSEIKVLEPELQFAKLGVRRDVPKGFAQLTFPQGNQITTASAAAISSQGTNPTAIQWGTTAYTVGHTQYGLIVQITDIAMRNSAFELLQSAVTNVRNSLARQIDNYIQSVVNAGTNVIYSGGKASRTALAAGDTIAVTDYVNAIKKLRAANVKPLLDGKYGAVMHPNVEADFMNSTGSGAWADLSRYDQTTRLATGTIAGFRGGVVMTSANVQTFASTVTVYPTTFVGEESFGWGYFQQPTPIITSTPDSANGLNLFTTIGAKAAVGAVRFEEARIARVESAATA